MAWLLERLIRRYQLQEMKPTFTGVPEQFRGLLEKVHSVNRRPPILQSEKNRLAALFESVGRATVDLYVDFRFFVAMLGAIGDSLFYALRSDLGHCAPHRPCHYLYRVGWQAVPIMMLITFLIGGIIAQQGIFHFRKFGADAYVIDMVASSCSRVIGV